MGKWCHVKKAELRQYENLLIEKLFRKIMDTKKEKKMFPTNCDIHLIMEKWGF